MHKKILKSNAIVASIIDVLIILLLLGFLIVILLTPSQASSWNDLGKFIVLIAFIVISTAMIISIIAHLSVLIYLKTNKYYYLSIFLNVAALAGLIFTLYLLKNWGGQGLFYSIEFLFIIPSIINIICIEMIHHHKIVSKILFIVAIIFAIIGIFSFDRFLIINKNKINVNDNTTYSCSDFIRELENRNLINKPSKEGQMAVLGYTEITARDTQEESGYRFDKKGNCYGDELPDATNKKFPMFMYRTYTSLIKKHPDTAPYYDIGPEDWAIEWIIYYVNGEIYAVIGNESEYGSSWAASLARTPYGVVVSEYKDITIYNFKKNYMVKGGGILDICDTKNLSGGLSFPITKDINDDNCIKIKVVDEVNDETLDKIAKELAPEYWKIYKKGWKEE